VSGEKLEKWKVFGGGILGAYTVALQALADGHRLQMQLCVKKRSELGQGNILNG
jgi:hypothetical protein